MCSKPRRVARRHCVLGQYHQHSTDVLDLDLSPLAFMRKQFPPSVVKRSEEVWRSYLFQFGFSTSQQSALHPNLAAPHPHPPTHPLSPYCLTLRARTPTRICPLPRAASEIGMLSEGQKSRLILAMMAMKQNSLLLLDEPTNHLDVDAVDGLAAAIKGFGGGVILVSHDFRLIDQVCNEIWVCENKGVRRFDGTIHDYKTMLVKKMGKYKV